MLHSVELFCTFSCLIESFVHPSFRSFSQNSRASTPWRRRPPSQLSSFMVLLLAAGAALTVQGQTLPGNLASISFRHLTSFEATAFARLAHSMRQSSSLTTTFDNNDHLPPAPPESLHRHNVVFPDELVRNLVVRRDKHQKGTVEHMEFQQTFRELAESLAHLRQIRQSFDDEKVHKSLRSWRRSLGTTMPSQRTSTTMSQMSNQ